MVTIIKKGTSIKEIKKRLDGVIRKKSRNNDIMKYAGKLKHLDIDPLKYQKNMRDEWQ
jgi:hypothetical protein